MISKKSNYPKLIFSNTYFSSLSFFININTKITFARNQKNKINQK